MATQDRTTSLQFATDDRIAFLHIGRGGWTGFHPDVPGSSCRNCHVSHYGDTWKSHELTPDCIGVDTTTVPDDQIVHLAVSGPMYSPNVPAGMVSTWDGLVPWQDDGKFGNARGLHTVAVDVYAVIARRFGATIFNPHES